MNGPKELVVQLEVSAVLGKAQLDGGVHVAADGVAVHPRQPLDGPHPFAPQPQPEDLRPEVVRLATDRKRVGLRDRRGWPTADHWEYDGPVPPAGFPGDDAPAWGLGPSATRRTSTGDR